MQIIVCIFQKNLEFYLLCYVILNFIIHMLDKNLQFYQKISPLPFQMYSKCICRLIIAYAFFFSKNLQFYKLSYAILNFIIHMLEENLQFYKEMFPLLFLQLHSFCICMHTILSVKITTKIFNF